MPFVLPRYAHDLMAGGLNELPSYDVTVERQIKMCFTGSTTAQAYPLFPDDLVYYRPGAACSFQLPDSDWRMPYNGAPSWFTGKAKNLKNLQPKWNELLTWRDANETNCFGVDLEARLFPGAVHPLDMKTWIDDFELVSASAVSRTLSCFEHIAKHQFGK